MAWLQTDSAVLTMKAIGLVMFVAMFAGVLLWLILRRRSDIRRWSELPLDDDPPTNHEN